MGQRGRKSSAELSIVHGGQSETSDRPKPPTELSPEQAEIWRRVAGRMQAGWFTDETHDLLAQYCRHVVSACHTNGLIREYEARETDEFDIEDYARLLRMQDRESRAISSLATKMRITQQSTYDKSKRKPKPGKRPWQS